MKAIEKYFSVEEVYFPPRRISNRERLKREPQQQL